MEDSTYEKIYVYAAQDKFISERNNNDKFFKNIFMFYDFVGC